MKVLIDIGHPAHVHFFKNAIWELESKGHEVKITARDKEIALKLLDAYGFIYENIGKNRKGLFNKAIGMLKIDYNLYKITKNFDPDIMIGLHSPYVAHISTLLRKKSLIFTDTEHGNLANMITFPFATTICTPSCFKNDLGNKQIRYNGYHELSYLHPNYFNPDPSVLDELGLALTDRFIILRFVAWRASHDRGHSGIRTEMQRRLIWKFEKYGRVLITSENPLPSEFESYRITVSPEKIHDLLYYATLLFGESATMASECAILGTPAIFIDFAGRGYTDEEEEKYGMVFNFRDDIVSQENALRKAVELLENKHLKEEYQVKRTKLINDKIDGTKFMVDLIERKGRLF